MPTTDKRIDAYIQKSQPFAQPILTHLRSLIHKALPEVEETIKWGMPFFMYAGEPLCNFAAFKAHCAMGFWKMRLMKDVELLQRNSEKAESAMGHLGRITSKKDLPADKQLTAWLKEAAVLNEKGLKAERTVKPKAPIKAPPAFTSALKKNAKAKKTYDAFSPSHQRAYLEWITEAKTDATREKRIATSVEWLSEGKSRMWKYEKQK